MTPLEQRLLDALTELETAAAATRSGRPSTPIRPILDQIDRLGAELPPDSHPDLRHYLQRKSLEKARLFLLGRDSENAEGNCGH